MQIFSGLSKNRLAVAVPVLLLMITTNACKGPVDGDIRYANFKYAQTQCADPWPYGTTDAETEANAKRYLDSLAAYAITIQLRADGTAELCSACSCKSGKVFHAYSTENNAAKFTALGFVRE